MCALRVALTMVLTSAGPKPAGHLGRHEFGPGDGHSHTMMYRLRSFG